MDGRHLTSEERIARRRTRRRRGRRNRAGLALAVAASLGGGVLVASWPSAPGGAEANAAVSTSAAKTKRPERERRVQSNGSALGSGRAVTLTFGGDVHFESPLRERLAASDRTMLAPIAPVLRAADVAMVNLETAVTDGGAAEAKEFVFRAPARAFHALRAAGVDVATMANNHGMDFGVSGLRDSLAAARRARLPVVGIGMNDAQAYAPYRLTVEGQRIAIIGATQVLDDNLIPAWTAGPHKPGLASAKAEARLLRAVREARATSDTLVVYLHWGRELAGCPTAAQRSLARRLVGAGADIVVGSHAHVLLGTGRMGRALVSYGLGNFVFYALRTATSETGVLRVTVTGRRIDRYGWVPARISGSVPHPLSGKARRAAVTAWHGLRSCTGLER